LRPLEAEGDLPIDVGGDLVEVSSATETTDSAAATVDVAAIIGVRDGSIAIAKLIDAYMAAYAGRDCSRGQRLRCWQEQKDNDSEVRFGQKRTSRKTSRPAIGRAKAVD